MKVTEELIRLCLNELATQAAKKQKYKDYYDGSHSILQDYAMQDSRSNRKLIFNFPRKFVDNETGYLLGKPVNFISKSDNQEAIDCIDTNLSYWDKGHNITFASKVKFLEKVMNYNTSMEMVSFVPLY